MSRPLTPEERTQLNNIINCSHVHIASTSEAIENTLTQLQPHQHDIETLFLLTHNQEGKYAHILSQLANLALLILEAQANGLKPEPPPGKAFRSLEENP